MKYTFQHFIDIQTSASSMTLFQVQAGGEYAMSRIKHLVGAFKYVKLGRVSVKFLPASTLPVDPLGLSYDDDDPQTVDPRDQMNPGLVRITNGEDIFTDFAGLSAEAQEQMYINTMLDSRWSKFMLQSGFKRSAVPLYYTVGQLAQDPYPGAVQNIPGVNSSGVVSTTTRYMYDRTPTASDTVGGADLMYWDKQNSDPRGLFQTGHRGRMGWMPTDAFYHTMAGDGTTVWDNDVPMYQPLPEVNVITCLLPKAHKTSYYYRCFITETIYLSGLKNTGINTDANREYRAIDNFIAVDLPVPKSPATGYPATISRNPKPANDGGGN